MIKFILYAVLLLGAALVPLVGSAQPPAAQKVQVETLHTPDSSYRFAMGDFAGLHPKVQEKDGPCIRYLSLYHVPKDHRKDYATTVSFVLNSLSKRKRMAIPVFVGASDQTLIRINLKDYDIDPKAWEELGSKGSGPKATPEPYFHAYAERQEIEFENKITKTPRQVEKKVPTGYYTRDQHGNLTPQYRIEVTTEYTETVEKVPSGKVKRTLEYQSAPWLDPTTVSLLCKSTSSQFPVMRADWFIVNATVEPAYHKLLGFGEDIKSFEAFVFANEDLAKKAKSQMKGVVVKSSVARNNRTLTRSPTFTDGYYWISHDTLKSINEGNYVQNVLDEKFDATEVIASLPNGLQAYFVGDDKGKRLDKADNEIATDHLAADRIVRNGRSCIYCHAPGINPIQDEIRTLNTKLTNKDEIRLLIAKEEDYYRIQDLFSGNLDKKIIRDQQLYADAIAECTGLEPAFVAKTYHQQWEGYTELLITKEVAARECGLTMDEFNRFITFSGDPTILAFTRNPIRPVRRDQWERAYRDFMIDCIRIRNANGNPVAPPAIVIDPDKRK